MKENEWEVYASLLASLSEEDIDDVLLFVKVHKYALKGGCVHPSNTEWVSFKPWRKYWYYIRVRFWAGIASLSWKKVPSSHHRRRRRCQA